MLNNITNAFKGASGLTNDYYEALVTAGTGSVGCEELNGKELRPRERGIKDAQSKSGNFLGCKMSFDEVVKDPVNIKTTL